MTSSARIDDLQRKYEENPRRYFAPLASELRRAGEARRAVALCEAELAADPGHLSGHVVLGQALGDVGDPAGSERAFARAIELDPENLVALRSLGDLARDRGDRASAREWYQRALEADPRDPELATRLATLPDRPPQPTESAVAAEPVEQAVAPADVAPVDVAPGESLLDDSMEREFQEQRDAQEFTAGFFAALLEAQEDEAQSASAAVIDVAEGSGSADTAHVDASRVDAGEAVAGGDDRPLEVTIADEPPDVRPDEPEYLDDLMEPHVEAHVEPHIEAAAAEIPAETEPLASSQAADAEPEHLATPGFDDEDLLSVELDYVESGIGVDAPAAPQAQPTEGATVDGMPLEEAPADEMPAVDTEVDETPEAWTPVADSVLAEAPVAKAPVDDSVVDDTPAGQSSSDETPVSETPVSETPVGEREMGGEDGLAEESSVSPVADDVPVEEETPRLPFVTATMGTLLLQQGFRSDALQIFRQLAAQQPDDADLRARVTELEAELAPPAAESVSGPTVGNWLRQLAGARPATAEAARPRAVGEAFLGEAFTETVAAEPTAAAGTAIAPEVDAPREAEPHGDAPHGDVPHAGEHGAQSSAPDVAPADDDDEDVGGKEDGLPTAGGADLLASAAAAAASAVTWESTEATPAADALFFGDDPLDWGQVASPETSASPAAPAAGSTSELSLEELLGRPASSADELAAGALAAATLAMQGDADVDAQLAEASAEDPSALEHVLSPTPTSVPTMREGASFSFEQFFRPDAPVAEHGSADSRPAAESPVSEQPAGHTGPVATDAADEAAAREADLADFHAWLAGLSKS